MSNSKAEVIAVPRLGVQKVFAVFDVKADVWKPPFTCQTRGVAVRAFGDAANDSESDIARHPEDYKLVLIGEWDDAHGLVRPVEHESLGFASDYVRKGGIQ